MKRVTSVSLNFGSGASGSFFALDFLIYLDFDVLNLFFSLFALCSVLGAALLSVLHTCSIQTTPYDVITHTWQVLHTTTPDQHNGVLLQVMTFTWYVSNHLHLIGKSHFRDLPQG